MPNEKQRSENDSLRRRTAYPKDQNSAACMVPLRGDSHLFTARMVHLFENTLRNQSAISTSAALRPACSVFIISLPSIVKLDLLAGSDVDVEKLIKTICRKREYVVFRLNKALDRNK